MPERCHDFSLADRAIAAGSETADNGLMRRVGTGLLAAGAGLAAVVLLTGCSLGPSKELQAAVETATPAQREALDCSWDRSYGDDTEPSSDYGCTYRVKGRHDQVIRVIRARLAAQGFTVSREPLAHVTALVAVRERRGVCALVVDRGFALSMPDETSGYAREISQSDDTPPGYVDVDVSAYKLGANELMPAGTDCER